MIVQPAERPKRAAGARANREMAVGLVALALLTSILIHYALGFACLEREGWPCRPSDTASGPTAPAATVPPSGPAAVPFLPTSPAGIPGGVTDDSLLGPTVPAVPLSTSPSALSPATIPGIATPTAPIGFESDLPPSPEAEIGDMPELPWQSEGQPFPTAGMATVTPTTSAYPPGAGRGGGTQAGGGAAYP